MSVMHLNDLSSTLTLGSDVLSAACASDVTACRTITVDTIGSESLVMALLPGLDWCERCIASMSQPPIKPDRGDHDASKGETSYHWNYTWTKRLFTSPTPQVAPSRPSDRASRRLPAAGVASRLLASLA